MILSVAGLAALAGWPGLAGWAGLAALDRFLLEKHKVFAKVPLKYKLYCVFLIVESPSTVKKCKMLPASANTSPLDPWALLTNTARTPTVWGKHTHTRART